jgi:hypothetical protein
MGRTALDGFTNRRMTQTQNAANETTGITGGRSNSPAYDAAGSIVIRRRAMDIHCLRLLGFTLTGGVARPTG